MSEIRVERPPTQVPPTSPPFDDPTSGAPSDGRASGAVMIYTYAAPIQKKAGMSAQAHSRARGGCGASASGKKCARER